SLNKRIRAFSRSHGNESIALTNGNRIAFRTRTRAAGRGFAANTLILDEAQLVDDLHYAALAPALSAQSNAQTWLTGTVPDESVSPETGRVFARARERAIAGEAEDLAYLEWSAEIERPELLTPSLAVDRGLWRAANPALGIRISEETIEHERVSLDLHRFA